MASTNPYYRQNPSDEQFAQETHESQVRNKETHSQYNANLNQRQTKPYFPQAQYPPVPSDMPPPRQEVFQPRQEIQKPFFQNVMNKFTNRNVLNQDVNVSECKFCKQITPSFIVKKNSFIVWILCIILLFATYVCFFLPFLFDSLKNKHVICKNCGQTKYVIKMC